MTPNTNNDQSKKNTRKRFLSIGCGLILLLIIICGGIVFYQIQLKPYIDKQRVSNILKTFFTELHDKKISDAIPLMHFSNTDDLYFTVCIWSTSPGFRCYPNDIVSFTSLSEFPSIRGYQYLEVCTYVRQSFLLWQGNTVTIYGLLHSDDGIHTIKSVLANNKTDHSWGINNLWIDYVPIDSDQYLGNCISD